MSENKGNLEECENDQGTSCEKSDNLIQPSKSSLDEASSSSSSSTSSSSKENSRFTKLASPVFGASSFSSSSSFTKFNLSSSLSNDKETSSKPLFLRPSQLLSRNSQTASSSSSTITNNPFAKNITLQEETNQKDAKETEKKENASTKDSMDSTKISPKFVPLAGNSTQHKEESSGSQASSSSISGFVFGQNLHERVAVPTEINNATTSSKDEPKDSKPTEMASSTNGSSMLFSSVLKQEAPEKENSENSEKSSKSLSEAAREYEESRAIKRKYQEVTIVTGEEDEANVLQVSCKLFSYDKSNGNWVERGRGTLRLNDMTQDGQVHSRVIMRTTGSLRVILNTKIWSGMAVEKTSTKSVRLTAMDATTGQVKVFLVMSTPKDIDTLYRALQTRVNKRQLADNACPPAKRISLDLSGTHNDSPEKTDSSTGKSQDSLV